MYIGLFYYTLGNVSPKYRSTLSNIQLVAVIKKKLITKYTLNSILDPIVQDIAKLVGIFLIILTCIQEIYIDFIYVYDIYIYCVHVHLYRKKESHLIF